jgi:CRP-like cAMP-binding protein
MTPNGSVEAPKKLEVDKLDSFFREMGGVRFYKPMQRIISDGDDVDGLYLLVSGTIGFYKNGVNVGIQSSQESTFFGELALIMGDTHRTADVVSLTDCEVRVVFGDIDGILKGRPDIAKTLMINNATRLLNLNKLLGEKEQLISELQDKRIILSDEDHEELRKMYTRAFKMDDMDNRWLTGKRMLRIIEGKKPPSVIRHYNPEFPITSLMEMLIHRKREKLIDPQALKLGLEKKEEKDKPEGDKPEGEGEPPKAEE